MVTVATVTKTIIDDDSGDEGEGKRQKIQEDFLKGNNVLPLESRLVPIMESTGAKPALKSIFH